MNLGFRFLDTILVISWKQQTLYIIYNTWQQVGGVTKAREEWICDTSCNLTQRAHETSGYPLMFAEDDYTARYSMT